MSGEEAAKVL